MTERQWKMTCKWAVENSNRRLSKEEKELIKQAIDSATNIYEIISIALVVAEIK